MKTSRFTLAIQNGRQRVVSARLQHLPRPLHGTFMHGIWLPLTLCLVWPSLSFGHDSAAIDHCIAANSGAESQVCLQQLLRQTDHQIKRLQNHLISQMSARVTTGELTASHYRSAITALQQANINFKQYRDQECDWFAARSGAVASGYQQQRLACLIRLNRNRIGVLRQLTNKNHST